MMGESVLIRFLLKMSRSINTGLDGGEDLASLVAAAVGTDPLGKTTGDAAFNGGVR